MISSLAFHNTSCWFANPSEQTGEAAVEAMRYSTTWSFLASAMVSQPSGTGASLWQLVQ